MMLMSNTNMEANWKILKGKVKTQWGKLTDDELDEINGRREELVGTLQKKYGKKRDEIEKEVSSFFDKLAS